MNENLGMAWSMKPKGLIQTVLMIESNATFAVDFPYGGRFKHNARFWTGQDLDELTWQGLTKGESLWRVAHS